MTSVVMDTSRWAARASSRFRSRMGIRTVRLMVDISVAEPVYSRPYRSRSARPSSGDKRIGLSLSPRVRGNLGKHHRRCVNRRSIPACAGEPLTATMVA